ncbi:MAG: hypothetical protein EBR82_18965, partial [Caulobacteraceae bacterium]|nr:hypothetical protein [Caulobacteraceae bacterium]
VITGHVVRHVYTSVGALPTGMLGTTVSTETQEADGYTLYTVTTVQVTDAILPDEVATRYNGVLSITVSRKINSAPSVDASKVIKSEIQEGQGYTIYSKTTVTGSGQIEGEDTRSLNNLLTTHTGRAINTEPTAPTGSYVTLIADMTQQEDGYYIRTKRWVYGSGLVDTTDETRTDGSVVTTKIYLNSSTGASGPSGSYKVSEDSEPGVGYNLFTIRYYTPPQEYNVNVNVPVKKPGVVGGDANGIAVARSPAIVNISAVANVKFVTNPTVVPVTPINSGTTVYERAHFTDGKQPEYLFDTTSMPDYYQGTPAAGSSGTSFRGRPTDGYSVSVYGAPDQSGNTLVLSCEAEPYFRTPSVIIYKVTKVTGVL